MLRQDTPRIDPEHEGSNDRDESTEAGSGTVDIQRELNRLEEMILDSPRIPFSRRTLIDEEQLLDQLDVVRLNLPAAFNQVEEIIRQKEEILLQAEQYAQEILEAAEQRASEILDEMGIVRQAKLEADRLRQQVQQDCERAREQTLSEIDHLRRQTQQEIEDMRRNAIAECEAIEKGADEYADRVLGNIEGQLSDMLRVIRNGRSQLHEDAGSASPSALPPPARGDY
ncbi:ATP synthase F0 subunit B [Oxynema aestuarii]|jgi:cell division septum initiation protein DivIVA|uniref:DivIVA domain-containing protein n=1 Tax=Oxynema aestuarii AP17 TaxID=2064643 RepID=A0A6H1TWI6_9CYAN|nr:DivIVA domain-containing protein [Oxynema aestuarii]QIZ70954.1 DivIVA domain-containing protein [Oxynema aestuarii AP17]RMH77778.1 MAG: DivIVA domain-containing protein [Cyanobacteria bacterium J007]